MQNQDSHLLTLRNLHTTKAEYVLEKNGMRRESAPHKTSCHIAAAAVARQVAKVRWEERGEGGLIVHCRI